MNTYRPIFELERPKKNSERGFHDHIHSKIDGVDSTCNIYIKCHHKNISRKLWRLFLKAGKKWDRALSDNAFDIELCTQTLFSAEESDKSTTISPTNLLESENSSTPYSFNISIHSTLLLKFTTVFRWNKENFNPSQRS
jgi:hypothetical protein